MPHPQRLVEVQRFLTRQDADVARAFLESCGIPAQVFVDNEGNMAPHLSFLTGARVVAPADRLDEARRLLQSTAVQMAPDPDAPEEPGDAPDEEPTPLGEEETRALERVVDKAFKLAILGLVFIPMILNLMSLALIASLLRHWGDLPPKARRKLTVAGVVDAVAIPFWALFVAVSLR